MLQMKDIEKNFGVVKALKKASIEVYPNEIVGLVGENGAGKSTLMKVLLGIHKKDGGEIIINGKATEINGPKEANSKGICMVFQDQSLLTNMAVYENLFLGEEEKLSKHNILSKKKMIETAKKEMTSIGLEIDTSAQVNKLTFVQRQMVEIARSIWKAKIAGVDKVLVIFDEPTSALGEQDSALLFEKMAELKKHASIIFISHKLKEIVKMCDRTYVLKDGYNAGLFTRADATEDKLRFQMVGGAIEGEYYLVDKQRKPGNKIILKADKITKNGKFENVSFEVHSGEIFCVSGTIGSGKETLCDVLYGLEKVDSGEIYLEGKRINLNSPIAAVKNGIGLSPADRKGKALIMGMSVTDNITVHLMKGILHLKKMAETAREMIVRLKIKTESEKVYIRQLSGGNQQKTIMARLMLSNSKLIILSNPTRGVDVGAKQEIYGLIRELAEKDTAIILMGDSFEEDIGLANTIMTLKDGKCTGIIDATNRKPLLEEFLPFIV